MGQYLIFNNSKFFNLVSYLFVLTVFSTPAFFGLPFSSQDYHQVQDHFWYFPFIDLGTLTLVQCIPKIHTSTPPVASGGSVLVLVGCKLSFVKRPKWVAGEAFVCVLYSSNDLFRLPVLVVFAAQSMQSLRIAIFRDFLWGSSISSDVSPHPLTHLLVFDLSCPSGKLHLWPQCWIFNFSVFMGRDGHPLLKQWASFPPSLEFCFPVTHALPGLEGGLVSSYPPQVPPYLWIPSVFSLIRGVSFGSGIFNETVGPSFHSHVCLHCLILPYHSLYTYAPSHL